MIILFILFGFLFPVNLFSQYNAEGLLYNELELTELFSSKNPSEKTCYRIPSFVTTPNGYLLVAADQRVGSCDDLRSHRNINIAIRRSPDNGKNWSDEEIIVDFPDGQSASDPSMIVDFTKGIIFLFYNFMDLDRGKGVYYHMLSTSFDNGQSWSSPRDITKEITKPQWKSDFKFISSGRGFQTSEGILVHTLVHLDQGVFLFTSEDHGKSWILIDVAIHPADESIFQELPNGCWLVNSRVNGAGMRYIHLSCDRGKSWNSFPDSTLRDPGCHASLIPYNGTLIFSNPNDSKQRKNLGFRLSHDQGKSWSESQTIYQGPSAYSSMSPLPNGNVGIVFEKDNYNSIVFSSFSLLK